MSAPFDPSKLNLDINSDESEDKVPYEKQEPIINNDILADTTVPSQEQVQETKQEDTPAVPTESVTQEEKDPLLKKPVDQNSQQIDVLSVEQKTQDTQKEDASPEAISTEA